MIQTNEQEQQAQANEDISLLLIYKPRAKAIAQEISKRLEDGY